MKLIINNCYGGFGIREDIIKRLDLTYYDSEETRTNPELIAMIEAGENINGDYAKLKIIEIPDNCTDYYIDEYDGLETIIYVVDGKLHWA